MSRFWSTRFRNFSGLSTAVMMVQPPAGAKTRTQERLNERRASPVLIPSLNSLECEQVGAHSSKLTALGPWVPNDPLVGRRLGGRVEIRAPLGAGGMGKVYREEISLDQPFQQQRQALLEGFEKASLRGMLDRHQGNFSRRRRPGPDVLQVAFPEARTVTS
jgi:hypothetical protein